jgi:short-subunit dehydrogenase
MQAYRQRCNRIKEDITVTDIVAGFIKSEMTDGKKGMFWVSETEKAVKQILTSIEKKKPVAYITRRWRLIAWLIHLIPDRVIDRLW